MKQRLAVALTFLFLLVLVFAWQMPAILHTIPSRYVSRLPTSIQSFAVRDRVQQLPTAVPVTGTSNLLLPPTPTLIPTPTLAGELPLPATWTPVPENTPEPDPLPTSDVPTPGVTPSPSPTFVPLPTLPPVPSAARLENIVHQYQGWNNCGPATVTIALSYFGLNLSQDEVASSLKPDPEDRNVSPDEISRYINTQTPYRANFRTNGDIDMLRQFVSAGVPVMIEIGLYPPGEYAWLDWFGHYQLVVAYDDTLQQFWVYDSWLGTSEVPQTNENDRGRIVSYEEMSDVWRHFNRNYIAIYSPEKEGEVRAIIGEQIDDAVMWQNSLTRMQAEVEAEPENSFLWYNLGTIYTNLEDYKSAAAAFDKARAIGLPWRMLWYQFGPYEAYMQTERYEDVIVLADITLQSPYIEEAYYYKGLAQAALGQTKEAIENLQRAVDFNPNYLPASSALARLEN